MGIEQAFSGPNVMYIPVGERANYRPYELKIAELEGRLRASREGIDELVKLAEIHKERSEHNGIIVNILRNTISDLIAQGKVSREDVNNTKTKVESELPPEHLALISKR